MRSPRASTENPWREAHSFQAYTGITLGSPAVLPLAWLVQSRRHDDKHTHKNIRTYERKKNNYSQMAVNHDNPLAYEHGHVTSEGGVFCKLCTPSCLRKPPRAAEAHSDAGLSDGSHLVQVGAPKQRLLQMDGLTSQVMIDAAVSCLRFITEWKY